MRLLSGTGLCLILAVMLPCVFILGVLIGPVVISPVILLDSGANSSSSYEFLILSEIRLPRAMMAGLIGAVLAMSGAVLQASFTILVTAKLTIIGTGIVGTGISALASLSLVALGAFLGGMLAVMLVYRLSTDTLHGTSISTMLLVGVAVMTLASALQNVMSFLADSELLRRMSIWQMGNLDLANWARVSLCVPMLFCFILLLRGQAKHLNALLLGESEARHLGVDVVAMKRRIILLSAMGVGVVTALAGSISFIGLVVPHLVRLIAGPDHRYLILASGLLGAILLILADVLARMLLAPSELPVGVVTAFLGVPFFIFLLRRQLRV